MKALIIVITALAVSHASLAATRTYATKPKNIIYGTVEHIERKEIAPSLEHSAVMGGVFGALHGGANNRDPALAAATFTAIAEAYGAAYSYRIQTQRGESITVITRQPGFYEGDCVTVDTTPPVNLQRVALRHCERD
ncbi:MAG: hypothetical protein HOC23_13115 [Halieaceae bacterium]|jgi:hypothetical protein|nr:hypothetical protein [Halieaceae bacterium]